MKKLFAISFCLLILFVCVTVYQETHEAELPEVSIVLSDDGISVDGGPETDSVFTSHDIIYYEDRDFHPNGSKYGEGLASERHSTREADAHTVVNITAPGTYRISGKLSAGQIRINLGREAYSDPQAVVNLILSDAEITCTVAPAVIFLNVFECGGKWSRETASAVVDTTHAGANLILEGRSTVSGSHVAKIYKDNGKSKKLWKQDGAIHSYMSMNISGSGSLDLTADLEGISSQLHLTILGGDIVIRAFDDGINASQENVSVVTINGGFLRILSGLGEIQGDGIDSNGYLIFNGGTSVIWSTPLDSPMDSAIPPLIHGGTVIAFGSNKDIVSEHSTQVTLDMVGRFHPNAGVSVAVVDSSGHAVLGYDPAKDPVVSPYVRDYAQMILSCPQFIRDTEYTVFLGSGFASSASRGIFQNTALKRQGILLRDRLLTDDAVTYCYGATVKTE